MRIGTIVAYRDWLGVVTDVSESYIVYFFDGAMCEVRLGLATGIRAVAGTCLWAIGPFKGWKQVAPLALTCVSVTPLPSPPYRPGRPCRFRRHCTGI